MSGGIVGFVKTRAKWRKEVEILGCVYWWPDEMK